MRKIKLFLSIVLSIFFLASCSLNSTQRPANPGNDVIEPGEEGYTVTVKDFETKELIISLTKKSTNIIRFADLKLNEIEGYTITLVDEVGNPTEIEDIKHTCTLYVKYAPNTYKLSFIEQGSRVETLKVTYNENVSPIEATLIPTGYEFLGWSEKKDEYVPYTFDKMPAHNVEVYAHYQLKEYAITLETKIAALEGLANISKYHYNDRLNNFVPLELQEAIKALPKYTLVGWYIDEALTIPFENISMPACDLTLYAKWEYDGLSFVDGNNIIGIGSGSIGDPIITPTPVEKEGFQFIGWYYDEEFTNEVKPGDLITEGLQNIYAYYKPLNNVEYRVEYYLQTFGVSYTLTKTDKFSGTTGTLVNADVLAFEGFTFDQSNSNNLLQANILANGSLTLKVYYSRNAYNVVYNTYDGEYATYENVKYGDAVLKPANPSRVGYTFAGWDQEVPTLMPNNDVVLNALWTANTNTAYKVEHYIEKLDGTYELKETENLTGTTDTNAVAVSKLYSGFTFNASHALNLLEGNIEADGSRVLKVYYSRNSYTLTINVDGVENNVSYKYEEAVALPTTPTKVGYTFSTWSPEVPSTMPANNVKVVAEWQVNEYTLTINVDGVKTEVVYEYGETVEAPTDPSKDGHTFTGWSPEVPSTMPAQNLTINATWKVNQYTITIKYDNETEDKVITQDYDSVIEIVPDPSKTGHTFTGWVTDTGVATVVPAVMPAKDLELTATWSINEYTITIKYDNETEDKVITQDYNTNIETIENPTKVGHTFTGWDQEIPSKMPAQNLTINATWEINEYSINYDLDGGTFVKYETREEMVADFIKDFSAFSGETITTPAAYWKSGSKTSFWRDAEMHAKWSWIFEALIPYAKQQVIDLQYLNNMLANPISISGYATQNVAIYLLGINATIWNETYKATYGGLSSIYTTVDCTSEEVLNSWEDYSVMDFDTKFTIKDQITLVNPNKFGYTFLGWFDTNNQLVTNIPQGTSNDVELKAKWEANPFNITYNLDGGSFARYETREEMVDDFLADFSTFSGETITTPAAYWKSGSKTSFWRDAEMHAKWSWIFEALIPYAKQQGIDLQYLNNMLANPISISGYATQNVAIYLLGINATIWNETYKETYGGLSSIYTTVDCTSAEVLENWKDYCLVDYPKTFTVDDEVALVNPKKLGYTFLGWYDSNNNLVTSIAVGTSNDVELTAKWEAKEYTVTVDIDGVKTPYTFTYGETIEIADPTKTGHTFTGWTPSLPSTMPANNLEVAARWTIKQFTITIVYDNGNENTVITQDYNSAIEAVADPTKTGHTFAGWSQAIPSTMPAEDLTIRANWTVNKYAISYDVNSGTGSIESAEATYGVDFVVSDGTGLTAPTGKKLFMWTDAEGNEYILGETYQFSADTILVAVWEAENLLAKFDLGANGDATHKDGGTASSYSLEVPGYLNTYTLDLTSLSKVYKNAYDAKGNSCLKLGTGSATASFSFTVPDDVKGVVIYVSGYKANKATITINGVEYSINTSSDEGAYTAIKVDTSSVKTINFATLSTPDERCMINGFEFLSNLVEYTISFNANGGSGSIAEATVNEANKYTIPDITGITPPTGKKFSHWEDADGEKYNPLDEILLTKDTELIAQWVDEDVSKEIGTVLANNTDGTEVEVEGTVVAVSTKGFVLQDATGAVFIYQNAMPTVAIGDTVNVKGTLGSYNGGRQIASPTVAETTIEKYTPEAATVLTKEQLEAFAIAESVDIQKISINGSILINGNYYNLILSETTLVQGSLYNPIDEIKSLLTNNKEVIAEGYVIYTSTSNGNNYINVIVTSIVVADVSVSFSAGEGTGTIDSQTVKSGDSITIPSSSLLTAPSGKVFINWVDQDGVEYEEGTTATIYSSTTLTAVWGNSNITISFNANGGTGSVESQTITSGGSIVIPNSDVLSYEGMKFSHWEDADGNEYQVGDTAYFDVTTELKAIWIDQYFLAEFEFGENVDTGHADGSSIDSSKNYTSGSYSLAITGASKVYDGANDALGNSALKLGTSSAAGKLSFTVPDDVTEVIIYVAGYKAKTAKVLVNGIEYTVTEQSDSGEYLAIKVNTSVNKNVSFETLSGGYRAMIDKIEFKNTPQQIENITISFNIGEGTGSIASQEIAKGSTLIIPDATGLTAPTGKALSHWTDASAKEYAIGSEEVFNEATELIAVWVDLITISFNVNGGTGSIESISILKDSECEIPDGTVLTPPSGMKFSHWTDVSENIYNSGYKYTFDVSTELIAVWISDSITITKADLDTMNGGTANYSYGTYTSTNGWVVENAAVNSGHDDAGHASNPNFGCLGDASVRAVTLNGRTTAVGKLTSPVLDGGLSKVSFNYAWLFSDTKFSITINVKDVDGNIIRTKTLEWTNSTVSKQTAEQFVWELESPVSGQYQIEFVNNCPSASTSNKDRATIWNIELAGYNA